MRLIDADALKKELEVWVVAINQPQFYNREEALYIIDSAPTADAVPVVRGKWIPNQHWEYRNGNTTMSGDTGLGCSACGAVNFTGINQRTPFCPHCGARMEGES